MIKAPAGWTQHFGEHLVTLYPPSGGGRIRVYERLRPVLRFSKVIEYVLESDPLFRVSAIVDSQTLTTDEGEYGAWCRLDGTREGQRCSRFVACIFGDEFTFALDAFVLLLPQLGVLQQAARELALTATLKLGVRRRRYLYEPPAGWTALTSGLVANWYPPDFPANRVNLVVPAAEPSHATLDEVVDVARLIAGEAERGFGLAGEVENEAVHAVSGLTGRRCVLVLKHLSRPEHKRVELSAFAVAPYIYMMRLESLSPEQSVAHHQAFLDTVRSTSALPLPGTGRVGVNTVTGDALSHWVD